MSIAPFLPGLPVPAAADGGLSPDASGGDTGSGTSAFGDALAAALAGTLATTPAPTTAPAPAPTPASAPALPFAPDLTPPPTPLPSTHLGIPAAELGIPSAELGVPAAELGVPDPAPRRTTDGAAARDLTSALASAITSADTADPVAAIPSSTRETTNSIDETANSADRTANSGVGTPNSASGTPNSASGTPNSASGIPNSASGTPNSAVTKAVVQQVFPEVTRFVSTVTATTPGSAGARNGTHRITLTLQPEQLGEVRVTLVVRDGAVHVRLAGAEGVDGAAVHRALAGEAPELQRILERTGADARVTVRDPFALLLPSTAPAPQPGPDARSGAQPRPDRQDGQDQQATREQPRGQSREQPRRQEPQRASYPIEPTPVAGRLDRTV